MKKSNHASKVTGVVARLVLLLGLAVSLSACATHSKSTVKMVPDISAALANPEVRKDYNYYYDGAEAMPFTIVGLKKTYALKTEYFSSFDPKNGYLRELLLRLHSRHITMQTMVYNIINPAGGVVGIVYTSEHQMDVKVGPGKEVRLPAPYSHGSHPSSLTGGN